jgi:hypothetical protein
MTNEAELRREIEALRAENAKLREFNEILQVQRKEYLDAICGPADAYILTDEEMAEQMKDLVPFSEFLSELGLTRKESVK